MTELSNNPDLKDINAYKKKLTWGDVPSIYHMTSSSIGDLDGILTHGFDSAFKRILNKERWNLAFLGGSKDVLGNISVERKPQILLQHHFSQEHYELHCFPIIDGSQVNQDSVNVPNCPFTQWYPEVNKRLFRVSSLVAYMTYAFRSGDDADMALVKYAHIRIQQLISILRESFDVVDIKGYNIAELYKEIAQRSNNVSLCDLFDEQDEKPEL